MYTVSITDLRQKASNILNQVVSTKEPAYIIQNSEVKAVVVNMEDYQFMQEAIEDLEDGLESKAALKEKPIISIDEYISKRWGGKKHESLSDASGSKRS